MDLKKIMDELQYQAICIPISGINYYEISKLINELINLGVYYDEFMDVLYPNPYRIDESYELALKKLKIIIPENKVKAIQKLLEYHIQNIADPTRDTFMELQKLIYDSNIDFSFNIKKYVGDFYKVENLIGLYWSYDDLSSWLDPASKKFAEYILELRKAAIDSSLIWLKAMEH